MKKEREVSSRGISLHSGRGRDGYDTFVGIMDSFSCRHTNLSPSSVTFSSLLLPLLQSHCNSRFLKFTELYCN